MNRLSRFIALLVFVFAAATNHSYAQLKTDSLRRELSSYKKEDTGKARLLVLMAKQYYYSNADSQYKYATQALAISRKLQYTLGIIASLEEIGSSHFLHGNYDSSIYYQQEGLKNCYTSANTYERSALHNNIANALFRKGQYYDALNAYDSAMHYALQTGNKLMQGKASSNIANIFYIQGNYTKALSFYLKGLTVQEELGNITDIASDMSNIANVYMRLGDYKNAIAYNNRGLAFNRKAGAKGNIIANLTTAAIIYNEQKQYDSSKIILEEALGIAISVNNEFIITLLKGNIAEVYLKKGDYPKSLQLYKEAKQSSQKMNDAEGVAIADAGIGEILCKQGNTATGLLSLKSALNTMQQIGIKEQARDISGKLAAIYEQHGDYKNALQYVKINDSYRDSLLKDNGHNEAQQMLFNYEIEKKETEITLLEKDKALSAAQAKSKNILLLAAFIGIILAGIIAYMFFRNSQSERKRQSEILRQKEEIEKQAANLKELNDFKDVTFSVLSHDLRSPVNALTGTMMMLDEKLMTPEEFAMHKNELNNKLQSVSLLLENMLFWAQSRMKGEHALDIEKLNIKRKALKTMAVLKDAAAQKNINLTYNIPEGLSAYGDANQVDIVLRNLVSNAIKFTPESGSVTINGFTNGNTTQISVTDTGVGMTDEQLSKLFKELSLDSTRGTGGEKGTGLGLQLCYEFIKKNGGDIVVTSTPGKGSTFTITLPNTI